MPRLSGLLKVIIGIGWLLGPNVESVRGQVAPAALAPRDTLPSDFMGLAELLGGLRVEIEELERRVGALLDSQPRLEEQSHQAGRFVNAAVRDSGAWARRTLTTQSDSAQSERALAFLERLRYDQAAPARLATELGRLREELGAKKRLERDVRAKLGTYLDPAQGFKKTMSQYYAALIAFVIIGFFFLAFRFESLRDRVFSGQTGMQFLTLFSLVIAIILFGITGVLEGKELSALLGGLSGYILGRNGESVEKTGKNTVT